jgi:hypothetical protein
MWQGSAPLQSAETAAKTGIASRILTRLLQMCCQHRFSWPHTGPHGQDYQVCLICGSAYEFDVVTMTRTGRIATPR